MKIKELAPIALFTYNRPYHTQQVLEALQKNELSRESELFVFSDGAKTEEEETHVAETRVILSKTTGFKKVSIIRRPKNFGLAANIIDGVTTILEKKGKIIVLEDDLLTAPSFLSFMNKALV
ncbi:MAG: glycosyltransferase, partial [Dysgonamonadaceae bacterium]